MSTVTLASLQSMRKELVNSKYYLNIRSGYMAPVTLHCSYGDSGETITFYIFDGGDELDLTGSVVSIHGTRRDGANFGPFTCSTDGNSVSFTLQSSMTAVEGGGIAEFTISKNNSTIGSCNFGILVENAAFPNGVAYDSDPSVYQDILAYVQESSADVLANCTNLISQEALARSTGDANNSKSIAANSNAISVERARIDNYLSSGTAATNAELIDIRTRADGVTLSNAGNAVRSLGTYLEKITTISQNLLTDARLTIGKAWNNSSNTARAIYIVYVTGNTPYTLSFNSISQFDEVSWIELASFGSTSSIVGYTITSSPVTYVTKSTTNVIVLQFNKTNISRDSFAGSDLQLESGNAASTYAYPRLAYDRNSINNLEYRKKYENLIDISKVEYGKEYNSRGELIDSSVVLLSDYIPVLPEKKIYFSNDGVAATNFEIYYVVEFNASKSFIRRKSLTSTLDSSVTVPTYTPTVDAYYIRFEININKVYKTKAEYLSVTPLYDTNVMATVSMFDSIAGVGDSYTAGYSADSTGSNSRDMPNQSYIAVLGKRSGVDWYNYGVTGATTATYITNSNGLPKVLAASSHGLYIINLGQNDVNQGTTKGTINDIHDDVTLNPNTFYGNYGRIVRQIIVHAPTAKIILVKSWVNHNKYGTDTSYQYFDEDIENIANYFGIPCIAPFDDPFFNSPNYQLFRYSGHPTVMGYNMMGIAMERLISNCIMKNPSYFRYSTIG